MPAALQALFDFRVGTAALGCPAERSSAASVRNKGSQQTLSSFARLDSRGRLSPRNRWQLHDNRVRTELRGGYFFGAALLAEFLEEIFLAERIGAAQQTEQQVFRLVGCLGLTIILLIECGEGTGRDQQLRQRPRATGEEVDECPYMFALFRGA